MGIKKYKPTTPSRRGMSVVTFDEITKKEPERSLILPLKRISARNNQGRRTVTSRGGGNKRLYRIIDFKRNKFGIPAKVASIEYDPNRSCHIALLNYKDGEKRYILAPLGIRVGDVLTSGEEAEIRSGNTLPLSAIPLGTSIHNIELRPGKGGQIARSAGQTAQLLAREGKYAHIRMPSSEVRLIHVNCLATIGQVGNLDHENVSLGKAGKSRYLGRRPHTRGVAMNPVDHPLGGGEGKSSGGRHPCTPKGTPTKGYRTRKKKLSNKMIVRRRKK